jgi:hypothetical protein
LNSLSIKIRYAAEVFLELAFIFSYVWYIERNTPDAFRFTFFYGACVAFPLACIALEQRGHFPEFSLDWDIFVHRLIVKPTRPQCGEDPATVQHCIAIEIADCAWLS